MQVDDILTPCRTMQVVDILRYYAIDMAASLKPGDREMCRIGFCVGNSLPADKTLRPIALSVPNITNKVLKLHRLLVLPAAIIIPVLRNPGRSAAACATQDGQALMAADKLKKSPCFILLATGND